mmetsp:Transcript_28421/g.71388  ORF Transcript_28421/g.71388 Transcript_28421/m.71388 type:complete len:346 (+) Transcript_28421:449-1486(+)
MGHRLLGEVAERARGAHCEHTRLIAVHVAVVRRREDSEQERVSALRLELAAMKVVLVVAALLHLVAAHHAQEVVGAQEAIQRLEAEHLAAAAIRVRLKVHGEPLGHLGRVQSVGGVLGQRVGPEQVAEHAGGGHLGEAVQCGEVGEQRRTGRRPAVHTEHTARLGAQQGGHRQAVEHAHEELPDLGVVLVHTLLPKVEVTREGARLVVAAQQEHLRGIAQLEREQIEAHLGAKVAAVHVVAQEEVALAVVHQRAAALLQEVAQVVELPVQVAHHLEGRLQLQQVGLGTEHLAHLLQDHACRLLGETALAQQVFAEQLAVGWWELARGQRRGGEARRGGCRRRGGR